MRHTETVDWRVKTFEPEAVSAFAFLTDRGFAHNTEKPADMNARPRSIVVRFHGPDMVVEVRLDLAFMGEDTVVTAVQTVDGPYEFGPATAHKGHEMRKALGEQASEVRRMIDR